jgi:hypothetical protein
MTYQTYPPIQFAPERGVKELGQAPQALRPYGPGLRYQVAEEGTMMHLMSLSYEEVRELSLKRVAQDLRKQFHSGCGKISIDLDDDDFAFVTKYRANRPPQREIP